MIRFQSFRLDTPNQCLWNREDRAELTPKAFDVLRYLVEHAGRLVTPDEMLEALWPDAYVNPEGLRKYIQEIRKVLGDRPDKPVFIRTLPKRGYQFIAPVIQDGTPEPLDIPAQAAKTIVGRELALAELERCLDKTLRGQRQVVFVTGEPGIGKTALVDEFQRQVAAKVTFLRIARGQCVEGYGGKEPYYPMLEALAALCRGAGGECLVQALAAQAPTWLVQFPALVKQEHRELLQREILGATRERMLREICEVLETITSESPLVLLFEDLHWADHSTVDLISALARRRLSAKLMVIGTYRPVDVIVSEHPLNALKQDLSVHQLCREIALEPLGEAEVAEYLAGDSSGASLPQGLASLLYQHSEGNPLFMVSALDDMTERGLISPKNGSWQLEVALKGIDLEVPRSLQQMIEVQIERLSAEEQRVLEAGSLQSVGHSRFGVVSRAAAIDLDPEVFEDVCEMLSRRHRIVRSAGSEKLPDGTVSACYEFVHVLYREVCYRRIAAGRRAQLHRRVGEWAEVHWEPLSEAAAWLARHFELGGDWVRAVKYLQLAADMAGRRFEPRLATEILEHALELAKKLPDAERTVREIEILEKVATIYVVLVDDIHAIESSEALAVRAANEGLIGTEARALVDMAYPLSWTGSERSLKALERALLLSDRQKDPNLRARTRAHCFAQRLWQRWHPQDVEEFHKAFAEVLNADDNYATLGPHLADCGFINWICSEYREARRRLIESRVIKLETADENPYLSAAYLVSQCIVLPKTLLFLGEWGEALRDINNLIAMLNKNGDYLWGKVVNLNRAWVQLHAMDFAGVLAICNSTLPLIRDPELRLPPDCSSPRPVIRLCLLLTGAAETALGNYESALEHLLLAREEMDRTAIMLGWYHRMQLESALTELWLAKGDLVQARRQGESFLKIALATAEHTWHGLAWEVNARIAMAELDLSRAQDYIDGGLSAMEGFEVPLAAWRIHATAFELYQNLGDRDLAQRHLALSRETITKLANSMSAEEPLRHTFLSAPEIRKILDEGETPTGVTARLDGRKGSDHWEPFVLVVPSPHKMA